MFYRRQGLSWNAEKKEYFGNTPEIFTRRLASRCYAFRGHRVQRGLNFKKEAMYHWSVRELLLQIKAAREADIGRTCPKPLSSDERAAVWRFKEGFWVCDLEAGGTCGHGTAAGRARCFGENRVAEIREHWGGLLIIVPTAGETALIDLDRFYRVFGKIHLAVDSHRCAKTITEPALRPRFGRFRCHCDDFATFEVCVLTEALDRYERGIEVRPWQADAKIRKGKDEHPTAMHRLRKAISAEHTTALEAFAESLDF